MKERPVCMNPNCENLSIAMVGNKLLCGDCISKLQEIRKRKEEEYFNILINFLTVKKCSNPTIHNKLPSKAGKGIKLNNPSQALIKNPMKNTFASNGVIDKKAIKKKKGIKDKKEDKEEKE